MSINSNKWVLFVAAEFDTHSVASQFKTGSELLWIRNYFELRINDHVAKSVEFILHSCD